MRCPECIFSKSKKDPSSGPPSAGNLCHLLDGSFRKVHFWCLFFTYKTNVIIPPFEDEMDLHAKVLTMAPDTQQFSHASCSRSSSCGEKVTRVPSRHEVCLPRHLCSVLGRSVQIQVRRLPPDLPQASGCGSPLPPLLRPPCQCVCTPALTPHVLLTLRAPACVGALGPALPVALFPEMPTFTAGLPLLDTSQACVHKENLPLSSKLLMRCSLPGK